MTDKLQKILDSFPNSGCMEPFDNDSYAGIRICWSETGCGFGEYTFSINKKTGEFNLDNECMRKETVTRIIDRIIDEDPDAVKQMFHAMIEHGFKDVVCGGDVTLNGQSIAKEDYE